MACMEKQSLQLRSVVVQVKIIIPNLTAFIINIKCKEMALKPIIAAGLLAFSLTNHAMAHNPFIRIITGKRVAGQDCIARERAFANIDSE